MFYKIMVHKHTGRILGFFGTQLTCYVKCPVAGSNPPSNEISPRIRKMGVWFETDFTNKSGSKFYPHFSLCMFICFEMHMLYLKKCMFSLNTLNVSKLSLWRIHVLYIQSIRAIGSDYFINSHVRNHCQLKPHDKCRNYSLGFSKLTPFPNIFQVLTMSGSRAPFWDDD